MPPTGKTFAGSSVQDCPGTSLGEVSTVPGDLGLTALHRRS